MFSDLTFLHPQFFWLLLVIPLMIFWYFKFNNSQKASLVFSSTHSFSKKSFFPNLRHLQFLFRIVGLAFLIVAMARPRNSESGKKNRDTEGIDIMIALDVSSSMLAMDFRPNRLEAAKAVAEEFVINRENDRIGLVLYAGESFTQLPLTSDKRLIVNSINEIESDRIEDGTAIGLGMATAVNRLKESKAKSKIIILLTDGINNAGFIDPYTAIELAQQFNIRTYTIGIGTRGLVPYPGEDFLGNYQVIKVELKIDEKLLKTIAEETNGKYYRATNKNKLKKIYEEIDQLEKTKLEEIEFYTYEEKFHLFAILAGIFFLLELLLRFTVFRSII